MAEASGVLSQDAIDALFSTPGELPVGSLRGSEDGITRSGTSLDMPDETAADEAPAASQPAIAPDAVGFEGTPQEAGELIDARPWLQESTAKVPISPAEAASAPYASIPAPDPQAAPAPCRTLRRGDQVPFNAADTGLSSFAAELL